MSKLFLILGLVFTGLTSLAQDTLTIDQAKELQIGETLLIDLVNTGCRSKTGDRFKITRTTDSTYTLLQFIDFQDEVYLDGQIVFSNSIKESVFYSEDSSKRFETVLSKNEFDQLIDTIEEIILTNNANADIIAGDSSLLILQIEELKLTKKFKGWLSIENIK